MKKKLLPVIAVTMVSVSVISFSTYAAFKEKSRAEIKTEKLDILKSKQSDNQKKIEEKIHSTKRNSEDIREIVKDGERNLIEMRKLEKDQSIDESASSGDENQKTELEKRFFYSNDILATNSYEDIAKQEKDPDVKAKYEKADKVVKYKKALLDKVEKDFYEGKGTYEEWNKRIDELMSIDPCK